MRISTSPHRPGMHIGIRRRDHDCDAVKRIVVVQSTPERKARLVLTLDEAITLADALVDTVELDR